MQRNLFRTVADMLPVADSTSGKIMEKVGGMLGNTKMQEKGSAKREQAGYGEGGYGGSNDNNY